MHILYLHQYFCPPGGTGNDRSLQFSRYWRDAGHRVTILTSDAYFPPQQQITTGEAHFILEEGIEVHVLGVPYSHQMPFRQRIRSFRQFYRKALRYARQLPSPDIIYASSTPLTVGELGRRLAKRHGKPFVLETVDVWPDVPIGMGIIRNGLVIRWLHSRTNRIYREAARVITLSEGMQAQVLSHGVPQEKVKVVHNGTEPEYFRCGRREPSDRTIVLYAGTVGIANDLTRLLAAVSLIEKQGRQDILFRIMGEGNDLTRVKAEAEALRLKTVEFVMPVPKDKVVAALQQAHIGVVCFAAHPVLEANSANKFYDYLAAGLPVVINYEGWQAGYLSQWACGLSSPQGDTAGLAANLLKLADDPGLRETMGEKGVRLAAEKFDRKKLADLVIREFHDILNR